MSTKDNTTNVLTAHPRLITFFLVAFIAVTSTSIFTNNMGALVFAQLSGNPHDPGEAGNPHDFPNCSGNPHDLDIGHGYHGSCPGTH